MEMRRRLLLGLLSVLGLAVQASDVAGQNELPPFCGHYDCPKYQLVKQFNDFELRHYQNTRWVTTSLKQDVIGIGMVTGFHRLFMYINGNNAEGLKMNRTVPMMVYMPLKQPPAGNATMSFYVPQEVKKPPTPTDPEVYLDTFPAASVYVKTFGGYAFNAMYVTQAKALAENLRFLGLQFDDTYFVSAGYNSPFDFFSRHNEVWYMAKSSRQWEFLDLSAALPWV
ncbi:heme-binding protein 2-like [Bufo gargarizans]|uniref:heme-binding protein 2-like n=1 Tax=Bufo gargarizans TaxID=30331 RepID=UPI001CF11DAD|nr:heme-binding protein 2-like [Bufo gargarizans]